MLSLCSNSLGSDLQMEVLVDHDEWSWYVLVCTWGMANHVARSRYVLCKLQAQLFPREPPASPSQATWHHRVSVGLAVGWEGADWEPGVPIYPLKGGAKELPVFEPNGRWFGKFLHLHSLLHVLCTRKSNAGSGSWVAILPMLFWEGCSF